MKYFLPIWPFCFILLISTGGYAQTPENDTVSITLKDGSIKELVSAIESQTHTRFFYDEGEFDSVKISVQARQQPLKKVLDLAFTGTHLRYAVYKNQIFITQDQPINFSLENETFPDTSRSPKSDMEPESGEGNDKSISKNLVEHRVYEIGEKSGVKTNGPVTVAGYIRDSKTGEPLIGASITVEQTKTGTSTDQYGYYSISLPRGRYLLRIENIGMRDTRRQIVLYGDGKLNIDMESTVITLRKVVISAQKLSNVKGTQMGFQKLDIKTIKQIPVVFGEPDILRVVTTLPGVATVGEASTGLNVRGGAADQNLILFNDATIYNPSHFFGLFSAFNPEVVKDVELFKGTIPPKYGGRLSSVLNISSREGNKKAISGSAGIGPLTSRLNIEGPLIKDKSSFIIGGRTTYANWLLNLLPEQYKNSRAFFYDLNLSVTHEINKKNSIYLAAYLSQDRFNLNSDTFYSYGNRNVSLKWKHVFSNKLNSVLTGGYDRYQYDISSQSIPQSAYKLSFDVNQFYLKADFNYYFNSQQTFNFGVNSIFYKLHPGTYQPLGEKSLVMPDEVAPEQALESAVYFNDHYNISHAWSLDAGIRASIYNYLGPQDVNYYQAGIPKSTATVTQTVDYGRGAVVKTYWNPEYRASLRYAFNDSFSVKAGFNTQSQYISSITNTTSMAPTDIWKLSDPNIKPQYGSQVSLGFYKNLKSNTIETSVELYYKQMKNYLDYKSGAVLVMNHHLETDVLETRGKAYGVEFLVKKLTGKLNGWISYTWSRTFLRMNDSTQGPLINNGAYYPSSYDIPNNLNVIGNYRVTHRFSVSLNTVYATGRPITIPVGEYYYAGSIRTLYSDRNTYRIPDYFRMDFSMNIDGNYKIHQKTHNSWTIGVYNLTGRQNPYSVYYVSENGVINGYKLSIFGSPIPYINFNIRF